MRLPPVIHPNRIKELVIEPSFNSQSWQGPNNGCGVLIIIPYPITASHRVVVSQLVRCPTEQVHSRRRRRLFHSRGCSPTQQLTRTVHDSVSQSNSIGSRPHDLNKSYSSTDAGWSTLLLISEERRSRSSSASNSLVSKEESSRGSQTFLLIAAAPSWLWCVAGGRELNWIEWRWSSSPDSRPRQWIYWSSGMRWMVVVLLKIRLTGSIWFVSSSVLAGVNLRTIVANNYIYYKLLLPILIVSRLTLETRSVVGTGDRSSTESFLVGFYYL